MKEAFIEKANNPPNSWDKWQLIMMRQEDDFENTVIQYFKSKKEAEIEKEKFLTSIPPKLPWRT